MPNFKELTLKLVQHRFLLSLMVVIICFVVLRVFIFEAYRVEDDSMTPNFSIGDHFLVNKFVFGNRIPFTDIRLLALRKVQRGDVIVFEYPEDPSRMFVKRVIALPGDVVEIRDKIVYVNNSRYDVVGVVHKERNIVPLEQNPRDNRAPQVVPEHSYFVLGDNRDHSYDSRFWGFLRDERVKGLVTFRYWSSGSRSLSGRDKKK
jgi:signal peptidase I